MPVLHKQLTPQNNMPVSDDACLWAQSTECKNCDQSKNPPACCSVTTQPTTMNCFHGSNTTNVHFHGLHVSPQKPQDWVFLQLQPAGSAGRSTHGDPADVVVGSFQYNVNPLNSNQSEGTHWYHPHKHGSTAVQVGNGMAGAIIVEGPFDDWLASQFQQPLQERVLVLQQIHDLNFLVPGTQQVSANIPLVNGLFMPVINMAPGEIQRWRVVNATMEGSGQLVLDFDASGTSGINVKQIAMDGIRFSPKNYLCQPLLSDEPWDCSGGVVPQPKFAINPANRADFLVQAPVQPGVYRVGYDVFGAIGNQGILKGRKGRSRVSARDVLAAAPTQPAIVQIVVTCPTATCTPMTMPAALPPMPAELATITPTDPAQAVQFQILPTTAPGVPSPNGQFGISIDGGPMLQFDEDCAAFTEKLNPDGGVQWTVSQNVDSSPPAPLHVLHIHTNPFQVVTGTTSTGTAVKYPEPIWQDSITLPNSGSQNVINHRFEDYTGAFVVHCHFLGHEDRGMMLTVQTICPGGQWSTPSATLAECTTTAPIAPLPPCSSPAEKKKASTHTHERRLKD